MGSGLYASTLSKSQLSPKRKILVKSFSEYVLEVKGQEQYYSSPSYKPPSTSSSSSISGDDDLLKCLRPLLIFGRTFGILPISGLFSSRSEPITFKKRSLASVTSTFVRLCMILHTGVRVVLAGALFKSGGANELMQIAENAASVIFALVGAYIYFFMYSHTSQLLSCLSVWREYKHANPSFTTDIFLKRHVNLVAGILMTSAVLQNILSHWNLLPSDTNPQNITLLELYYQKHFPNYSELLPYNPWVSVALFVCDKWVVLAWTYSDVLIALIARAIYKQFQLQVISSKQLAETVSSKSSSCWERILQEHDDIVELLEKFNDLLRPLIFATVSSNVYFIAITLNRFLSTSTSSVTTTDHELHYAAFLGQVNSVWSFGHLLVKTFTSVVCCARVNKNAHGLEPILWKCPPQQMTRQIERAEIRLRTVQLGFSGLDYFIITTPFILSIFNVVFTFEIVLLQSSASSSGTK